MKKYSQIINIVLLIGIVILYILHFTGKEEKDSPVQQTFKMPVQEAGSDKPMIAFVNVDSLIANYELYGELADKLLNERSSLETELTRKNQAFEKEVEDFQYKVNKVLVTRAEAAQIEAQLGLKQQNLIALKDTMAYNLLQKEQIMNQTLHDNIINEIVEFNKSYNFQFVLSQTLGGSILYGNGNLNITKPILDILNDKYRKAKQ